MCQLNRYRAGDYGLPKNRPRIFAFKGGLFQNRYNHKGQVNISPYTQYMNVFVNTFKAFVCKGYGVLCEILLYSKYSNVYKYYSFFIVFVVKKREILEYIGKNGKYRFPLSRE